MDARVPPHSIEAEQAVLGTLLLANETLSRVAATVNRDAFYRTGHRVLWDSIVGLIESGQVADLLTVTAALKGAGTLEKCGGPAYLGTLADRVPSTDAVEHYGRIVAENALRRHAIAESTRLGDCAYSGAGIDELRDGLFACANHLVPRNARMVDARHVALELADTWEAAYKGDSTPGLTTGLSDLDRVTRLHGGDLVIVAGRPGMGKTSFALGVTDANLREGKTVLWFSLEMTRQALLGRLVSGRCGVSVETFRSGNLSEHTFGRAYSALSELGQTRLWIDDTPGVSSSHIRAEAQRIASRGGLDLIVVDYVGLVEESGKFEARRLEVGKISRNMVRTAKELNVPVMLLSQLNREVDTRSPPIPRLSDLRESGDLEQDADVVLLLYRAEEALKEKCPEDQKGTADVDVAKNRHGRTGTVGTIWHGPTTSFKNLEAYR